MLVPINKNECCGCGACDSVCPVSAIKMKPDAEGFLHPEIDKEKCIECGLCAKTCAFANYIKPDADAEVCYVAKHRDQAVRMNSRSGGIFVSCSDMILNRGGRVYGCILDDKLRAVHVGTDKREIRDKMCRSKYVQSDTTGVFEEVRKDLESGLTVLFSGTGCQIDGLNSFLKQKKTNTSLLYTMDIICHGCVSPEIYADYLKYLEKKFGGKVEEFDFRDKTVCGWDGHVESFTINGKKRTSIAYREIFYSNLSLRQSCYNCKYANTAHPADITIADAWGIKQAKPEFNDNRGVSLIIVNSEKGADMLGYLKNDCDVAELKMADMMQMNLKEPSKYSGSREKFWSDYENGGIELLVRNYGTLSLKKRLKAGAKYKLRQIIQGRKYYLP